MKLYYMPGACSMAAHIIANEVGQAIELVKVNGADKTTADGKDFLDVNPNGYVPALELGDGTVLTENIALLDFLASGDLALPDDKIGRAKLFGLLSFLTSELHKAFSPFFAPTKPADPAVKDKLDKRISHVEQLLSDGRRYLTGDLFTVADAYAFVILNWSGAIGHSLESYPNIRAFQQRVGARPAVQKALVEEGLVKA